MLKINNLAAKVADKNVLNGVDLNINKGEVHVIMGPNGSGKSTLVNMLAGKPGIEYLGGSCDFLGENLFELDINERALKGMFLGFQYPVEVPGVNNAYFLRTIVNAQRSARKQDLIDAFDFMGIAKKHLSVLGMTEKDAKQFLRRGLNDGFSGGERKRNEILQMLLLQPSLTLLDEIDSGLDIDALQHIADGINSARNPERSCVMVTHYQRLLEFVKPDFIHILVKGKIVRSGGYELASYLEKNGYAEWLQKEEQV